MSQVVVAPLATFGGLVLGYLLYKQVYYFVQGHKNFQHCFITGGSQGLGKALAIELAKKGAHITITARTKKKLEEAVAEIKKYTVTSSQKVICISCDVGDQTSSVNAIEEASKSIGMIPKFVFCCAGVSAPGYMTDLSHEAYESQMKTIYYGSVYTVKEAIRLMIKEKVKGKVVLVSSVLGMVGFVGWTAYAPAKTALRAFAECLRNEMIEYGIGVHIYFPGTIDSPGLIEEKKHKPRITAIIEGDDIIKPEYGAKQLIKGLYSNDVMITSDFIGSVIRASSACALPWNNLVIDFLLSILALIIMPGFRLYADLLVRYGKKK